jgi:glycine cleavage system H protein
MDIRFTTDHEWLAIGADTATVGITDHAQSLLGELVFVELPGVGQEVQRGTAVAVVESVKAASEVNAPLSGTIVEVNGRAVEDPSLVNSDPMSGGWLFKMRFRDSQELDSLLKEDDYKALVK